jgi:hypothetical protein
VTSLEKYMTYTRLYPDTETAIEAAAQACSTRAIAAIRAAERNGSDKQKLFTIANIEMMATVRDSFALLGCRSAVASEKLHNRIHQLLDGAF